MNYQKQKKILKSTGIGKLFENKCISHKKTYNNPVQKLSIIVQKSPMSHKKPNHTNNYQNI